MSDCDSQPIVSQVTPSIDTLECELTTLAAHLNAGNYRFLELLAEFDRRGGHVGWGIASCAHWLQWKCGIGLVAGREKVRVARALESLPQISEAMRRGTLSYCKVRALTRIATADNEQLLVSVAENGTVSHVEKMVRLYRRTDRAQELADANQQHSDRGLRCYFDESGCLVVEGRLDPERGALFMKALQAAGDALPRAEHASREASSDRPANDTLRPLEHDSREASSDAPDRAKQPYAARMADALALMGETFLAKGPAVLAAGDRHLVTVHIDEAVLRDEAQQGQSNIEDGPSLPPATVRRLCCDTSLVAIVKRADGSALDIGRKTRAIPSAMRRALEARDHGCRFPSCSNTRFVDGHHIEHWADGGETKLDNLVLLCRRHHRFVHEHGYRIERIADELRFVRPDGRVVVGVHRAQRTDAREGVRALSAAHAQQGIVIGPRTGVPRWFGERMDYGEAIGALQRMASRRRAAVPNA